MFAKILLPALMIFALSACKEVKVENGEVPDQYREMAKAYMGTYAGKMNGNAGAVTLALNGRKVVMTYKDPQGSDILDPMCKSAIGRLKSVKVSKDGKVYKLDSATFAFEPGNCWADVDGREVALSFKTKAPQIQMSASIILRQEWQEQCRIEPGNPRGGLPPREVCDNVPVVSYSSGKFAK